MPDDPKPKPVDWQKYSWLATPASIVLAAVIILAGPRYLPSVDPTPGPLPPAPVVVEPIKPTLIDSIARRNGVRDDSIKAPLVELTKIGNGTYTLTYEPDKAAPVTWTVVISGGGKVDPPVPVPPKPPEPPIPVPPEPPQPTGPLTILLIRESGDSTPEMAMLVRDLRTGPVAEYLKSKMHALGVLDPNAKDPDGKPSPAVEEWRPHFSGITLPALIVYDPTTKKVLAKQPVTAATTATQIMDKVKEVGG